MADWEPEVAVIPEDRALLLELVKLCKGYRIEEAAWRTVLVTISYTNQQLAEQLLAAQKASLETAEFHATAQFRQIETALLEGSDFLTPLREMLLHHGSASS